MGKVKSAMQEQLKKVNAELAPLLEIQDNLAESAKKIEHRKYIHDYCINLLSQYSESIVLYNECKIIIDTQRSRKVYLHNFIDFTEYNSTLRQKKIEYGENKEFNDWLDNYLKLLTKELEPKLPPILNEIIEVLNTYTGYEFFVASYRLSDISTRFKISIEAFYDVTFDFR